MCTAILLITSLHVHPILCVAACLPPSVHPVVVVFSHGQVNTSPGDLAAGPQRPCHTSLVTKPPSACSPAVCPLRPRLLQPALRQADFALHTTTCASHRGAEELGGGHLCPDWVLLDSLQVLGQKIVDRGICKPEDMSQL